VQILLGCTELPLALLPTCGGRDMDGGGDRDNGGDRGRGNGGGGSRLRQIAHQFGVLVLDSEDVFAGTIASACRKCCHHT
jgi:hypothetical protein